MNITRRSLAISAAALPLLNVAPSSAECSSSFATLVKWIDGAVDLAIKSKIPSADQIAELNKIKADVDSFYKDLCDIAKANSFKQNAIDILDAAARLLDIVASFAKNIPLIGAAITCVQWLIAAIKFFSGLSSNANAQAKGVKAHGLAPALSPTMHATDSFALSFTKGAQANLDMTAIQAAVAALTPKGV